MVIFSALECVSASHGAGTRPGIGNKRLMGVIIRVLGLATGRLCRLPLTKAKLHLPALDVELIVLTQEHSASRVPVRLLRLWCPSSGPPPLASAKKHHTLLVCNVLLIATGLPEHH